MEVQPHRRAFRSCALLAAVGSARLSYRPAIIPSMTPQRPRGRDQGYTECLEIDLTHHTVENSHSCIRV